MISWFCYNYLVAAKKSVLSHKSISISGSAYPSKIPHCSVGWHMQWAECLTETQPVEVVRCLTRRQKRPRQTAVDSPQIKTDTADTSTCPHSFAQSYIHKQSPRCQIYT